MSATVKHGRRMGSTTQRVSTAPETPQLEPNSMVLSKADWTRIQNQLQRPELAERAAAQADKQQLLEQSKQMANEWKNTIVNQRLAKQEAKKQLAEQEEARRVQLDLEEERFQAQKRKEALERAKEMQYRRTDKVRAFDSAVLMSEVLKERELQADLKGRKAEFYKQQDQELYEEQMQQLQAAAAYEEEKRRQIQDLSMNLAQDQLTQAAARRQERRKQRQDKLTEQQISDLEAAKHFAEEQRKEEARKQKAQELLYDIEKQTLTKKEMEERQREALKAEEERLRIYATSKEEMAQLRYQKEMERIKSLQEQRAQIAEVLVATQKKHEDNFEAVVQQAAQQKLAEQDWIAAEKARKQRENQDGARRFNDYQVQQKEKQKQEYTTSQQYARQAVEQEDSKFILSERQKQEKQRNLRKDMQTTCFEQMAEKDQKKKVEKEMTFAEREAMLKAEEEEQKMFEQYAVQKIEEARGRGVKSLTPMLKAANLVEEGRQPSPPKPGRRGNNEPHVGSTQQRMGFTWE